DASADPRHVRSLPTRRSPDLTPQRTGAASTSENRQDGEPIEPPPDTIQPGATLIIDIRVPEGKSRSHLLEGRRAVVLDRYGRLRSEEHTSELQSREISYAVFS